MTSNIRNLMVGIFICGSILPFTTLVMAQPKPDVSSSLKTAPALRSVGEVNPGSPIDIVVKNNTPVVQSAGFSGGANVKIEPGGKATLSFASAPVNLFVYPSGPDISPKYNVTTSGNTINVEVIPLNSITPGDGAINISRTGLVYVN